MTKTTTTLLEAMEMTLDNKKIDLQGTIELIASTDKHVKELAKGTDTELLRLRSGYAKHLRGLKQREQIMIDMLELDIHVEENFLGDDIL